MEDFFPWVPPISSRPPDCEEKEEEDGMSDLIHNFTARKRKRDASFKRAIDTIPGVAEGSGRSLSDEGSEVLTIVISGSLDMGLNDQSTPENITLEESKEVVLAPEAIQVIHPPKQAVGQSDKAKYTRVGRRSPMLLDRILLNLYLPPRGLASPRDEVSVPGPEGAQEIIDWWRPFNRDESSANRLHELYQMMLRMSVAVRAGGKGEEYTISVPVGTIKEDLQQMIEDGM